MKSDDRETVTLEGVVESVIYHNTENGFTVFTLHPGQEEDGQLALSDEDDELTCTGYLPGLTEGEMVQVSGIFVNNPRYGRQLSVSQAVKRVPSTKEGIEKYLASGVIKGIGARTAQKIVALFGVQAFDVIEEAPEKLTRIKGITLARALRISEAFHAQGAMRQAMIFLQHFGISPVYAMKIYKHYKEQTSELVKRNPYKLADDIDGIGFKIADGIARQVGVAPDSPARIAAGIRFSLWEAAGNGHVYLPEKILEDYAGRLLEVDPSLITNQLIHMQMERQIYREAYSDAVFLNHFYYAEMNVARKLLELAQSAVPWDDAALFAAQQSIAAFERESGLFLAEGQKAAILSALSNGVLVITGGPGTGKTTAINTLIALLTQAGQRVELAAPTGRAAKRMTEATGREAKTIHRLLEVAFIAGDARKQTFQRNEENPLETDVLIIDETSMVDILLMQNLLKAVANGTRLILVGDADQLPSVGSGNVLKDLIHSACLPVARLTEIFRQAQESAIVMNAHRINRGEYPALNEKNRDFFFVKRNDIGHVAAALVELVSTRLPSYMKCDCLQDIQVLTPMRKSPLGVEGLNQLLQKHLNPPAPDKKEREFRSVVFREKDKVMQIKNNYSMTWQVYDSAGYRTDEGEGIFNGDAGIIKQIDEAGETLTVLFDDHRQVDYDFSQLDELELAYAITIHKSQGSEYRVVVVPIYNGPPMLMSRNLLYTAVTRAKELVVLVGAPNMLYQMVDNNREINRYTALARRIQVMFGQALCAF